MSKRRIGLAMMLMGVLAIVFGLALGGYNLWDNRQAGMRADAAFQAIVQYREEAAEAGADAVPETPGELSVLELDAGRYIGTLFLPAIDIELPVQVDWSLELLKAAPCRYTGSPHGDDLILCAHNYPTHFGRLKNLLPGDEVRFTDVEGNALRYTVAALENLGGTAVEEMESGAWDLTLFTCTLNGQARVTVRCDRLETDGA